MHIHLRWVGPSIAAALFAVVFFWVLDQASKNDAHAERMQRVNAEKRAAEQRVDKAATGICSYMLGPGAQVLWTHEGDLVCRPAAGGVK